MLHKLVAPALIGLALFFGAEMFLLVSVATDGGWGWWVLWFEIATAMLGAAAMRGYQSAWVEELTEEADGLRLFQRILGESKLVIIGGILLILPGFITDAIGAYLMAIPLFSRAMRNLRRRLVAPPPPPSEGRKTVVDGEVISDSKKDSK